MGTGRAPHGASRDSETCVHRRKNSLSVQYPEATPTVLRTVCRVPGQIEVLKSFQGKQGPRGPGRLPAPPLVTPREPAMGATVVQPAAPGHAFCSVPVLTQVEMPTRTPGSSIAPPIGAGTQSPGGGLGPVGDSRDDGRPLPMARACLQRMWCRTPPPHTPTSCCMRAGRGAT